MTLSSASESARGPAGSGPAGSGLPSRGAVEVRRLVGGGHACALTVDVEEWYHNCHVPEYVRPQARPRLAEELDWLLPETLELLADSGCHATFFTLGEVARRLPARIREIAAAGHEVASHGDLHLRVDDHSLTAFRCDVAASKALLEDLVGAEVVGYRSPEWSLRRASNPRLEVIAELGFRYDSSLTRALFAGEAGNPGQLCRLRWESGRELVELPPLNLAERLRLPASGWPARLGGAAMIAAAAERHREHGGLPVVVIHPWELSRRPTPGDLTGLARIVHEVGRAGFRDEVVRLLVALPWTSVQLAMAEAAPEAETETEPETVDAVDQPAVVPMQASGPSLTVQRTT